MALAFRCAGKIDRKCFEEAWTWVADRVPILRSGYFETDGEPCRVDRPLGSARAKWVDFSEEPDPEEAYDDWARRQASTPMALSEGLVESALVKLGPADYVWWLNQHHLVTDASATLLVFGAVSRVYAVLKSGRRPEESDLELTLEGEVSTEASSTDAASAEHWESRAERTRPLPFYGECKEAAQTKSERHAVQMSAEQSDVFRAACTERGFQGLFPEVSRFAGWATVLLAWLHRISGEHDLSFHALAANRQSAEARRAVGVFIEVLPFAVSVEPTDTLRSLGARCLAETREYLTHAGRQTEAVGKGAGSNVVLNYFSGSVDDFADLPCSVEWVHSGHADTAHGVRLQVQDFGGTGAYKLGLDLNCEVFSPDQARRAVEHFRAVLEAFLADRDTVIAEIDVLTPWEHASLRAFNAPATTPVPKQSVWDFYCEQVARHAERPAITQAGMSLTFGALDARVRSFASHLLGAGVKRGDLVVIFQRRSIDAVASILATTSIGCAYVPIDPSNPSSRVSAMIGSSGAAIVLTESGLVDRLPNSSGATLVMDTLGLCDAVPALDPPSLDDLAYIIYTSGSTGEPKGVQISHGGLADYLTWADREYVRGDPLNFALFTSLGFDLTVTSIFLPLITGGHLHVYPDADGPVDGAFIAMMEDNAVDFIKLTPSHLRLMRQYDLTRCRVRRMVLGGEDLKAELADAVCRLFGRGVELFNEYGPTEAVVGCMIHRFKPEDARLSSVPIGRPADHVQLYVVNE